MGDRFYEAQKKHKPKRILKKDVIIEFQRLIGARVEGLDRLTIKTLDELSEAVEKAIQGFTDD